MADKKKEYSIAERLGETLRQAGGQTGSDSDYWKMRFQDTSVLPGNTMVKTTRDLTQNDPLGDKSIFDRNSIDKADPELRSGAIRFAADQGHVFNNEDLGALYGMKTPVPGAATSTENLAIIEKNRQDASNAWDTTLSNLSTMRAQDDAQRAENSQGSLMTQWRDAIEQAGIGNSTGGTIKTRDQSKRAIEIMDKILAADTAKANRRASLEASAANTAETRRYHDELIKQGSRKAPETVQGDDGVYAYNPDADGGRGKFEPTGIKNKPKEYKPETNLDEALKIAKIIEGFERAGSDVPASLREQLESALSGGTASKPKMSYERYKEKAISHGITDEKRIKEAYEKDFGG